MRDPFWKMNGLGREKEPEMCPSNAFNLHPKTEGVNSH